MELSSTALSKQEHSSHFRWSLANTNVPNLFSLNGGVGLQCRRATVSAGTWYASAFYWLMQVCSHPTPSYQGPDWLMGDRGQEKSKGPAAMQDLGRIVSTKGETSSDWSQAEGICCNPELLWSKQLIVPHYALILSVERWLIIITFI